MKYRTEDADWIPERPVYRAHFLYFPSQGGLRSWMQSRRRAYLFKKNGSRARKRERVQVNGFQDINSHKSVDRRSNKYRTNSPRLGNDGKMQKHRSRPSILAAIGLLWPLASFYWIHRAAAEFSILKGDAACHAMNIAPSRWPTLEMTALLWPASILRHLEMDRWSEGTRSIWSWRRNEEFSYVVCECRRLTLN